MKTRDIKTIDVQAKEWFDKVNGNHYFSAIISINYGLKNSITLELPFQYGGGDHYRDEAFKVIKKELNTFRASKENDSYRKVYEQNKIIARYYKQENCLKRELSK
ncbi:MAG: hypothetical protein JKY67_14045 [Pseudomonadales bacterium]|nr:hypothetical protein [Pseudomonadales bacterium]